MNREQEILSSGAAGVSENHNQLDILSANGLGKTKKHWVRNFEYNSSTGVPNKALHNSMISSANKFYSN